MEPVSNKRTVQAAIPQQWRIESIKNGLISFDCPICQEHYQFDSAIFAKNPEAQIEGLTKTQQAVGRDFIARILAFVAALVVYYYAHRWVNGTNVPLNQGIFVPVFIAVCAYSIAKPLLAGMFTIGRIPIFCYKCSKCQSDIFFAASPREMALPVSPSKPEQK
ncbi:MAG TPA: hypothetical protein PLJ78_17420 [Anaerolineae bacterium]|nr:hypothetical protein [Anaerolineae bacterium]HQK15711.1 hypothetical protein [Anaerolineae bacterium]